MNENKIITIDGPSASGKSTVALGVASKLKMLYVDSGSLYRGITWHALENKISVDNSESLLELIKATHWNFHRSDNAVKFSINNLHLIDELRTKNVREAVAIVASQQCVRDFVVESLRSYVKFGSLVIEGRDIGSVVFPNASFKFYLDADLSERAMRRYHELKYSGEKERAEDVLKSLNHRDKIDSTRTRDPLIIPDEAMVIDTTHLNIEKVIDIIINRINNYGFDFI